jgi:hypothetical protein
LRELRQAEEALALHRASRSQPEALSTKERDNFLALGPQLPALWQQPGMDRAHKKALLRCLIEKVILHRTAPERLDIRIVWRGGGSCPVAWCSSSDLRLGRGQAATPGRLTRGASLITARLSRLM